MKKIIALLCLMASAAALLISCRGEVPAAEYTCSEASYYAESDNCIFDIKYPVVSGTDSDELICGLLYDASLEYMNNYLLYSGAEGFCRYTIDSVTAYFQGEELASFLCVGSFISEGSTHPESIVYALNLDPVNARLYSFDDLISDFDLLADRFRSGKFRMINGDDGLLAQTNYADMFIEYSSLYEIYPPIYFILEDGKTALALSVELVYALGGHAEFSIDTDSVKSAFTDTLLHILNYQ